MVQVGSVLVVGADEEVLIVRWLEPGERRRGSGQGGLCIVARKATPSGCVVTGLAAWARGDDIVIAVSELMHGVCAFKYKEEAISLLAVRPEPFLCSSLAFACGLLLCADQSGDRLLALSLEDASGDEETKENAECGNRLPSVFRTFKTEASFTTRFAWTGGGKVLQVLNGEGDGDVVAILEGGRVAKLHIGEGGGSAEYEVKDLMGEVKAEREAVLLLAG